VSLGVDPAALDGWINLALSPDIDRLQAASLYFMRFWHTPHHLRVPMFASA
jgi:hypothetical protein